MNDSPSPARPTLLFVPDISGFTEFVNSTEITHSRHIIEELLELLIDANDLDLVVSEIEGDAILFYREGPPPTAASLLAQVERMYMQFHAHLRRYETQRICQCGACSKASGLKLKFILHHGAVAKNQIRDHTKLFGRDVIVAHRLMKNAVPQDEYVLMTRQLIDACPSWVDMDQAAWAEIQEGEDSYDFGTVSYCVIPLEPLRAQVPEPLVEDYGLAGAQVKVIEHSARIQAPMEMVFDVISDLSARHVWQADLKDSDRLNHRIPQHGATHRCVMSDTERDPFVVTHGFDATGDTITFTDTERRQGWSAVYLLRRDGPDTTIMEQHVFLKKNLFLILLYRLLFHRRRLRWTERSARNLDEYCRELIREGRSHPAQIVLEPTG